MEREFLIVNHHLNTYGTMMSYLEIKGLLMTQETIRFTHTDIELMRLRLSLTPGQRLQAMFDARAVLVGIIRGRLRQHYPGSPETELNLKVLEEIERAQSIRSWDLWTLINSTAKEEAERSF